jgi:predicted MFS family arabinose efflux permease
MTVATATRPQVDPWRATLSGLCASLVGIGLARFAYTPLLPAIVANRWFTASDAAYLGAANLAGYLLGASCAAPAASRMEPRRVLRIAMAVASASLFACAWPIGFGWFFAWRLLSGIAGGMAMVLAAPTVLPHVAPSRRGLVGGAIFVGVGLGVIASGTLVPILLRQGLTQTWIGLGALAAMLTLVGWGGWPANADAVPKHEVARGRASQPIGPILALCLTYGLNAFGLVPHMVFLVDYVARGLGQGLDAGTEYWSLFGLGATIGPVALGHLADRLGSRDALRITLLLEIVFVGLPALHLGQAALVGSGLIVGACTIGVVPVVLARLRDVLLHHPARLAGAWRTATVSFACFQAGGAYLLSFLLQRTGSYDLLFELGAGALFAALAADLLSPAVARREHGA